MSSSEIPCRSSITSIPPWLVYKKWSINYTDSRAANLLPILAACVQEERQIRRIFVSLLTATIWPPNKMPFDDLLRRVLREMVLHGKLLSFFQAVYQAAAEDPTRTERAQELRALLEQR